jgi:hypothetical protein
MTYRTGFNADTGIGAFEGLKGDIFYGKGLIRMTKDSRFHAGF